MKSNLHVLQKLFMLIEDIKFYGTQAFASLARFGFMAKQLLVGLVTTGALTVQEEDHFMRSVHTVSKDLAKHRALMASGKMSKEEFLNIYGHLRPGTYDIMSSRYDEEFELYFSNTGVLSESGSENKQEDSKWKTESISKTPQSVP